MELAPGKSIGKCRLQMLGQDQILACSLSFCLEPRDTKTLRLSLLLTGEGGRTLGLGFCLSEELYVAHTWKQGSVAVPSR